MEVVEQRSLTAQLVDIGSLDRRVAGKGHIAIALVVGDDDHDIGFFCFSGKGWRRNGTGDDSN